MADLAALHDAEQSLVRTRQERPVDAEIGNRAIASVQAAAEGRLRRADRLEAVIPGRGRGGIDVAIQHEMPIGMAAHALRP